MRLSHLHRLLLMSALCLPFNSVHAEDAIPVSVLNDLSFNPMENVLTLTVSDGGFDPILHLDTIQNTPLQKRYRVVIEGSLVQFGNRFKNNKSGIEQQLQQTLRSLQSINLSELTQNQQPTIKIVLDVNEKLQPQILENTGDTVRIKLLPIIEATSINNAAVSGNTIKPTVLTISGNPSIQNAWQQFTRGKRDEAKTTLQNLLIHSPEQPKAHYVLGLIALDENDLKTAENEFMKAIEIDPRYFPVHMDLILLYLKEGELVKSESQLDGALTEWPNQPDLLFYQGFLKEAQGQYKEAREIYQKMTAKQPYNFFYHYRLATLLLKNNEVDAAKIVIHKLLLLNPDDPNSLRLMGYIQEKANHPEEAQQFYQRALRTDVILNYAALLQKNKKTTDAQLLYKAAETIAPDSPEVQYTLGMIYAEQKDRKHAAQALNRFLSLNKNPKDSRVEKANTTLRLLGLKRN